MESFYAKVGGMPFFIDLVEVFYVGVESDDILRPMYPEGDLGDARRHLALFLAQYWGGPTTYDQERGHPRLRMRHAVFVIDTHARDRWVTHMRAALDQRSLAPELDTELWTYLESVARALINTIEQSPTQRPLG